MAESLPLPEFWRRGAREAQEGALALAEIATRQQLDGEHAEASVSLLRASALGWSAGHQLAQAEWSEAPWWAFRRRWRASARSAECFAAWRNYDVAATQGAMKLAAQALDEMAGILEPRGGEGTE